jgi:hypothetical protein
MTVDNLEERLRSTQEAFQKASTDGGFNQNWPPDGTYQGIIRNFDFFESKDKRFAFLKTEIETANHPEYAGMGVETIHAIDDPERIGFLKRHLDTLGVDVDNLDLTQVVPGSELLNGLLDVPIQFAIKTSDKKDSEGNPYRNCYVNQRLGGPMQSDVPADTTDMGNGGSAATARDEEIPF